MSEKIEGQALISSTVMHFLIFSFIVRFLTTGNCNYYSLNKRKLSHRTHSNEYSNTSQTRGSKLAKFSNSRFLSLLYTSKLAVLLLSTQIRDFCYFLSPKNREFGGITVLSNCIQFKYGVIELPLLLA